MLKIVGPATTYAKIVAFARANPGQFTCRCPDKGDSGSIVIRVIHEANGLDFAALTVKNFGAAKSEELLCKVREILVDLHPFTFGKGTNPARISPALQRLAPGARHDPGKVGSAPAGDQSGRRCWRISCYRRRCRNPVCAILAVFMGISWQHVPVEPGDENIDVIPVSILTFRSGEQEITLNDGWHRSAATNLVYG